MASRDPGIPRSVLGIHEQRAYVQLHYPHMSTRIRGGLLLVDGVVTPHPLADQYAVNIQYRVGAGPNVRVIEPELQCRAGHDAIPHMYDQERLCLYHPASGDWSPEKLIALTTVPWTALWLTYYELWRATGRWSGGGAGHPSNHYTYRRTNHGQ